ncbi:MAG: Slp family lipoprotein [Pseudomonadota bacterium]
MIRISFVGALALVFGCACSTTPDPILDAQVDPVTVAQAGAAPEDVRGLRVRWGGSIVAVRNRADETFVEILARPLNWQQAPQADAEGEGRFVARVPGFLDPSDYTAQRWMTVVGALAGIREGKVGDYTYRYPVVVTEAHRLWRSREEMEPTDYYPYYDPWWGPWYRHPWYGHPYHRRHPYWW